MTDSPATFHTTSNQQSPGTNSNGCQGVYENHYTNATKGRAKGETDPTTPAPAQPVSDGHHASEAHCSTAVNGDGHISTGPLASNAVPVIIELWRRRQAWHRAEKSLTLQASAICRRYCEGDKTEAARNLLLLEKGQCTHDALVISTLPLLSARDTINEHRTALEKELVRMAKQLPIAEWSEHVRGFGMLSLAALVGECGDVGSYKSVSAVWKRMGLAVIGSERQRKISGEAALEHGYCPQRRSVAWNIGTSLMRAQKAGDPYRDFYDKEKARQLELVETKGHAHNRATRHMTKRFLRDFYLAWRAAICGTQPDDLQPLAETIKARGQQ